MKVAYIFSSSNSHTILSKMIVPQLEKGTHGADVMGMFFSSTIPSCWSKGMLSGSVFP